MPTAISLALGPISAAVPGSLYQQIVDAVKREIGAGRLAPGSALPSFRVLAEELVVSVITVKRAYEELEREGHQFIDARAWEPSSPQPGITARAPAFARAPSKLSRKPSTPVARPVCRTESCCRPSETH